MKTEQSPPSFEHIAFPLSCTQQFGAKNTSHMRFKQTYFYFKRNALSRLSSMLCNISCETTVMDYEEHLIRF